MRPEEIDKFFSERIDELDEVTPSHWNPEDTFQKIQHKMKPYGKRRVLVPWQLSIAASVALVALTTASFYFSAFKSTSHQETVVTESAEKKGNYLASAGNLNDALLNKENGPEISPLALQNSSEETPADGKERIAEASFISFLGEESEKIPTRKIATVELPSIEVTAPETVASQMKQKQRNAFSLSHPFQKEGNAYTKEKELQVNIMGGVGVVANKAAPIIQLETRMVKNTPQNDWNAFGGGISIEGLISDTETGLEMRPHVFAEVSTAKVSNDTDKMIQGKGWSIGVLLNAYEDSNLKRDTFRLRYTWELKNKIRISPELLVSDGFQLIYPGIRITKG